MMDAGLNKVLTVVNEEFAKLPDHDQLIGKFEQKMRQMVVSPPTGDLEIATGRVFSAEEARTVLLQPSPAHAACYARVFAASIAAPADSSLHKTRTLLLTLHYLVHRKSWTFMADFVLADGLFALADLVFDSNLYERSQAMEIFLSATDCDVFDWFILPSDPVTQQLHGKLLAVGRQTRLLENLAANRLHSYPGGGFRALQVLAFWLSWVRALHTPGQVLTLPLQLQEDLRQWASRTDHEDPGDGDHSGVDETKLARTLFDDFCVAKPEMFETCGGEQTDPPTAAEESPKDMVVRLKYEGNVLFKQGDCSTAADLYKRALQLLKQGSPNDTDRSTMVTLLTNAANAQWQVYRVSRTADILNEVEICCLEAIAMDPCALKAVYRLCHCYLARNEPTKAQQLLEPLVLIRGDEGRPHLNLLRKVYFRCIANSPQRAKNIAIMSPMFVHIYNGLLSRNGMGSSHISLACPSLSEQLHKPSGNVPRDTNTMSLPPSSSVDMLQDMCSQAIKLPVRPKLAESLRKLAKRLLSIAKENSLLRLVGSNEGYITLNEGLKVIRALWELERALPNIVGKPPESLVLLLLHLSCGVSSSWPASLTGPSEADSLKILQELLECESALSALFLANMEFDGLRACVERAAVSTSCERKQQLCAAILNAIIKTDWDGPCHWSGWKFFIGHSIGHPVFQALAANQSKHNVFYDFDKYRVLGISH